MGKKNLENHFPDKPALMFVQIRTVFLWIRYHMCPNTHNGLTIINFSRKDLLQEIYLMEQIWASLRLIMSLCY